MDKKFVDDVTVIGVAWVGSTEDHNAFIANGKVDTSIGALSDDKMDTRVQELLTAT